MKNVKRMLSAGVLTATVAGGSVFALSASAATSNTDDTLASKIATKFNLNKDEVQTVIGEHREAKRTEHRAEHQQRLEERLTKAVTDGKITEEQKIKIIEYLKSQESFLESLKDKTAEERKAAMDTRRDEIKKWAADNGIDEKYVMHGGGHGGMGGPGGLRGGDREE